MKIKIKKLHENAVIPSKAHTNDAGYDLTATSIKFDNDGNVVYGIGLAFDIPSGYVGLLFPRSSNAKKDLILSNSVGVLDSGYKGEVLFKFKPSYRYVTDDYGNYNFDGVNWEGESYEVGDRIGQLIVIPIPSYEFEVVDDLGSGDRGLGGYGSTGN